MTASGVLKWMFNVWRVKARVEDPTPSSLQLFIIIIVAGIIFGLCMAFHVFVHPGHGYHAQVVASLVKVPLFLIVTLILVFPFLYGLSRLLRIPLRAGKIWRLATASVAATALALAGLGPVVAVCCAANNYSVVVLTSYACFILAGLIGAGFFRKYLALRVTGEHAIAPGIRRQNNRLTVGWIFLFGITAGQIGWMMRPFVGWTGQPFEWFRTDRTMIYEQIYYECVNLFHEGGLKFPDKASTTQPSPGVE